MSFNTSGDFDLTWRGETAIGSGFKFPRVISTSIIARESLVKKTVIRKNNMLVKVRFRGSEKSYLTTSIPILNRSTNYLKQLLKN